MYLTQESLIGNKQMSDKDCKQFSLVSERAGQGNEFVQNLTKMRNGRRPLSLKPASVFVN